MLGPILDIFKKKEKEIGEFLADSAIKTLREKRIIGKCLKCGEGNLTIIRSKATKKRFIGCSNYPDCQNSFPVSQKGKITPIRDKFCKLCHELFNEKYPVMKLQLPGKRPFNACVNWTKHPKKPAKPKKQDKETKTETPKSTEKEIKKTKKVKKTEKVEKEKKEKKAKKQKKPEKSPKEKKNKILEFFIKCNFKNLLIFFEYF
ncbi:MAG: topoisomerase DNA-binding C4 zinc finger domain-containing protein [Candidatus Hodarchaeota archaeon]